MNIQIIDVSEMENDGAFGVFVATLQDGERLIPVMVWYSLAEDRALVSSKNLTQEQADFVMLDTTVKDEMREAVMAERDARAEEAAQAGRRAAFQAKVAEQHTNSVKWSQN